MVEKRPVNRSSDYNGDGGILLFATRHEFTLPGLVPHFHSAILQYSGLILMHVLNRDVSPLSDPGADIVFSGYI